MTFDENMKKLFEEFPCREKQIKQLGSILGEDDECLPESLFVYGGPSVGKTSIIMRYLECVGLNYARVNCIECYSHRLMFDTLLDQLMPSSGASDKCDNLMQFLAILRIAHQKGHLVRRTVIVSQQVLDGIEKLEELSEHYLSAFSRLQELSGVSLLCTIFISHILPEKFNVDSSMIKIRFPQYNKDELLQILQRGKQAHCSEKFFKNYLNAVLSVFLRSTRDLNEMKNLVTMNFKRYCEPIDSGKVEKDDVASLWRHIVPHLKASLNTVYLRTGFRLDSEQQLGSDQNSAADDLVSVNPMNEGKRSAFDLPYYAKYFLVAAYLASYNSPKHDRRLYVKNHGRVKKRIPKTNPLKRGLAASSALMLGPKAFSLDRLFAIFYSIMEEKASLTANLMAQISTLVELRLLTRLGEGSLDKPKYKCFVDFQCVDAVARTLSFNLHKYLMD